MLPIIDIENKSTINTLIVIGKIFIVISFIIPALSLILRLWDYQLLKTYSFDQDVMNPASAICFILLSFAIWLIREEEPHTKNKFLSNTICIFIILIGVIRLGTSIYDVPFYLDEILFREQILTEENTKGKIEINLMSPTTGVILILIGTSILLTNYGTHRLYKIAQSLNYLTILSALLSIYGYVYQIEHLIYYKKFAPIPVYNTLTIFFITSGILFLRPHKGSMKTLVSENTAQIVFLRLLALFVPLLLGLGMKKGEQYGWFGKEFGTALYASATFAISMVLLGWKSEVQFRLRKLRISNQEKIERDRKLLRKVLNVSPSSISIIDLQSEKFLFTNRSNREQFRVNNETLQGMRYSEVMKKLTYEADKENTLKRFNEFKKLKKNQHNLLTYRIYDKVGKINWVYSKATGYIYIKDEIKSVIVNTINITKQKELQAELEMKAKEIEDYNKELNKVNNELEDIRKNLTDKVEMRIQDVANSEQACKAFFEHSFEGIVRYELKDIDGIDINLETEEQVRLLQKHTLLVEANKEFARIHGYNSPEEITGTLMTDFIGLSMEDEKKLLTKYVESGYRLKNNPISHLNKNGDKVHLLTNVIGIIKDNKLVEAWGTQKLLE